MSKTVIIVSALIFAASVMAQSTVRLEIKSLPAYHPSVSLYGRLVPNIMQRSELIKGVE